MNTRSKAAVTDTPPGPVPQGFLGHREDAGLDMPPLTPRVESPIGELLRSGRFDDWSEALARVGNCSQPVPLHGYSQRVDTATG